MADAGSVYYAKANEYIKIGWTGRPVLERLDAYPPGTQLLAVHPGTRADEGVIHASLEPHLAAKREWYFDVPEVRAVIDAAIQKHGEPPILPELTPRMRSTRHADPKPSGEADVWSMPVLTEAQIRALPVRVTFAHAARALGYRRRAAYRAVKEGTWPQDVPVVRGVTAGLIVDKAKLLRHLGLEPAGSGAGQAIEGEG